MRLPPITKPVPEALRTWSKRHGVSQVGCWLKVVIWMTERSGFAAKAPRTKQAPTPIKDKNRFATPQNGVGRVAGQALRGRTRKFWEKPEMLVEILLFTRTVCDHEKPAAHMARHSEE